MRDAAANAAPDLLNHTVIGITIGNPMLHDVVDMAIASPAAAHPVPDGPFCH